MGLLEYNCLGLQAGQVKIRLITLGKELEGVHLEYL